jgi:hypothetical protein
MIASEIIDRRPSDRELTQLLDALLHERTLVVEAPSREGGDPLHVGQHMGRLLDLVALQLQLALGPPSISRRCCTLKSRAP